MSEQEAEVTMKAIAEAAQCWCDPETSHIAMDEKLAHAFSHRIQSHLATEEVLRRESHRLRAENEILNEAANKLVSSIESNLERGFYDMRQGDGTLLFNFQNLKDALRRVGELK